MRCLRVLHAAIIMGLLQGATAVPLVTPSDTPSSSGTISETRSSTATTTATRSPTATSTTTRSATASSTPTPVFTRIPSWQYSGNTSLDDCAHSMSNLYEFGPLVTGDAQLLRGDDNYSPMISVGTVPVAFYGQLYTNFSVSANGVLSFGQGVPSYVPQSFPLPFSAIGAPVIAPYWADVDLRGAVVNATPPTLPNGLARNNVYYRVRDASTISAQDAARFTADVRTFLLSDTDVTLQSLIVATWFAVG